MYNQLLISLQIEEKWYTFRLFFGILSCYYLQISPNDIAISRRGRRDLMRPSSEDLKVATYS